MERVLKKAAGWDGFLGGRGRFVYVCFQLHFRLLLAKIGG